MFLKISSNSFKKLNISNKLITTIEFSNKKPIIFYRIIMFLKACTVI